MFLGLVEIRRGFISQRKMGSENESKKLIDGFSGFSFGQKKPSKIAVKLDQMFAKAEKNNILKGERVKFRRFIESFNIKVKK